MNEFLTPKDYYLACMAESKLASSLEAEKTAGLDEKTKLATAFFNQLVLDLAAKVDITHLEQLRKQAGEISESYEAYKVAYVQHAEDVANKFADYLDFSINQYKAMNGVTFDTSKFAMIAALQLESRKEAVMKQNEEHGPSEAGTTDTHYTAAADTNKKADGISPWLIGGALAGAATLGAGAYHYLSQPSDTVLKVEVKKKPEDKKNG